jgi:hypothetical protein
MSATSMALLIEFGICARRAPSAGVDFQKPLSREGPFKQKLQHDIATTLRFCYRHAQQLVAFAFKQSGRE